MEKSIGMKVTVRTTSTELVEGANYTVLHTDVTDKAGAWSTAIGGEKEWMPYFFR